MLSGWEAATGRLLWRKESGREFEYAYPYFGAAASPLVWNNLRLVHLGGNQRTDPYMGAGAMVALRVEDGKQVWRWRGDPAVGASPALALIDGEPHLVLKTSRNIFGLDPRSGKTRWRIAWRVAMNNTIVTPVVSGNVLIASDYDAGVAAWRIEREGPGWSARPLWRQREVSMFMTVQPAAPRKARRTMTDFSKAERRTRPAKTA